jgi:hypothetical protein
MILREAIEFFTKKYIFHCLEQDGFFLKPNGFYHPWPPVLSSLIVSYSSDENILLPQELVEQFLLFLTSKDFLIKINDTYWITDKMASRKEF